MQNTLFNILKYIALAAAIYLIFRFVPNSCMSNMDIFIITIIIILIYIIFDYLFSLNNNYNSYVNLSTEETNKICNSVCNAKENMTNINNIPSQETLFYNNSDRNSASVNMSMRSEESQTEDDAYYDNYRHNYYDFQTYDAQQNKINNCNKTRNNYQQYPTNNQLSDRQFNTSCPPCPPCQPCPLWTPYGNIGASLE